MFSALHVGSFVDHAAGQEVSRAMGSSVQPGFLMRARQALVAGRYRNGRPYSVEAVLLYGFCIYIQKEDPDADAWMILGISARLAMKMGYHRDPSHFANISPFEGEMRRRTFWMIKNLDTLLSFQIGLPAIVHDEECDTAPPSNLFDSDFDEV